MIPCAAVADSAGGRIFYHPYGVRSYGMGRTGVADYADPANVFYNPANLAATRGAHLTGAYGNLLPAATTDMSFKTGALSVGYQFEAQNTNRVDISLELRYSKLDYGKIIPTNAMGEVGDPFDSYERFIGVSAAGGLLFSNRIHTGFGVSVKFWKGDFAPAEATMEKLEGVGNTKAIDIGFRVGIKFLEETGYLLSPALGVSYSNMGTAISFIDVEQEDELPRMLRLGFGLRFETPPSAEMQDLLGAELPTLSVSVNFDVTEDRASDRSNIYGVGAELALVQTCFVRLGYIMDDDENINGTTLGAGLAITREFLQAGFDYARVPQSEDREGLNKYGAHIGVIF
jgi:hypothetical protein